MTHVNTLEADKEFREKYYLPHPPSTAIRMHKVYDLPGVWAINYKQSDRALWDKKECYKDNQNSGYVNDRIAKPNLASLQPSNLTIDWCTQWGVSSYYLAQVSKTVLAYECTDDTFTIAKTNLHRLPPTSGVVRLNYVEADTGNLKFALTGVPWESADIIRIGSRSASYILQHIRPTCTAHTIVVELNDEFINDLLSDMGYVRKVRKSIIAWVKDV